ncbi:MAG: hypothetical protein FWG84_08450 [Bacteroidales bacterium]|nr:hypothetical protein [Bacteroidales bacterium]
MQKTVVKYSIIFFLLLVYLNRGVFIVPYEAKNQNNKEINSVIELITQLVTGEDNGIDEDGDGQTDCNFTQLILYDFSLQSVHMALFSKDIKNIGFPYKEKFLLNGFCSRIDHPPEV